MLYNNWFIELNQFWKFRRKKKVKKKNEEIMAATRVITVCIWNITKWMNCLRRGRNHPNWPESYLGYIVCNNLVIIHGKQCYYLLLFCRIDKSYQNLLLCEKYGNSNNEILRLPHCELYISCNFVDFEIVWWFIYHCGSSLGGCQLNL